MALLCATLFPVASAAEHAEQCDPNKVLTATTCAKCHAAETEAWKGTPHFRTFEALHRTPRAKEIAAKMGVASIKRSELCARCHYTQQAIDGGLKTISGISCESCHGAARDWIALHNDYGGPGVGKLQESKQHAAERVARSTAAGMRNPTNLYTIARSCLDCHVAANEKLVNVGGHPAGSLDFQFVAWSQGRVKHDFLSHGGANVTASREKLRVMHVIGLVAELEFSTRATGEATSKAKYGLAVAQRAVRAALELQAIQQQAQNPRLEQILAAFAEAELRTNNDAALNEIANRIREAGEQLATELDGKTLPFVDSKLPPPSAYK
jgi:hypothetical protein